MNAHANHKPFPIPVVPFDLPLGPGSHTEDETLDYITMPTDMDVYRTPALPDGHVLATAPGAHAVLEKVVELLAQAIANSSDTGSVEVSHLSTTELQIVNQVLAEGEVSAKVGDEANAEAGTEIQVQESVFAGVWRLMTCVQGKLRSDRIEVGPVPRLFHEAAQFDLWDQMPTWSGPLPPNVVNAPALMEEIRDQVANWKPGDAPHVINLTLLPMTPEDIGFLDHHLGTGSLLVLSRGYGNCRIISTRLRNCWRVVYYNSLEKVILNTVEITTMPEVGMAALEDLRDSHERLTDILSVLKEDTAT